MAPAPPVSRSTVHASVSYELHCRGYRRREIESVIEEVSEGRDSCRGDVEQERPFFYHPPTLYFLPCLPPCSDLLPPCRPPPSTNLKLELNAPSCLHSAPSATRAAPEAPPFLTEHYTPAVLHLHPGVYLASTSCLLVLLKATN